MPWTHEGYKGPPPTVCPGYTCKLPEVIEAARLRVHWSKGILDAVLGGEPASDILIDEIEILDDAVSHLERWLFRDKS